jgi:hypothetical protein
MRNTVVNLIRRRGDEAMAAALTALVLLESLVVDRPVWVRLADFAAAVVVGAAAARRVRAPLMFLGLILAISVASLALPPLHDPSIEAFAFFVLLAVYNAAAHTSGRDTLLAATMTFSLYITDMLADSNGIYAEGVVFYALLFGAPWAAGWAVRRWRLSERRVEQEKARTAAAIADERARIARELHDVVAHSISVMVLQARGGRRALPAAPADVASSMARVAAGRGRAAARQCRRRRGVVRARVDHRPGARRPVLGKHGCSRPGAGGDATRRVRPGDSPSGGRAPNLPAPAGLLPLDRGLRLGLAVRGGGGACIAVGRPLDRGARAARRPSRLP